MSSEFYRAFEDRLRGSREVIIERLNVYLPFIEKVKEVHNPCTALDLGCGRGEWLQLLHNHGVQARGIDIDSGMLQACRELELQVEERDAIETLQSLPDDSLSVVSGFHLVEHIEFSQVQQLVEQTLRVLQPGGLLILETPNAENLVVGTHNFYLDPTHIRPVPHILLSFVTELAGFTRNKVLRLQENPQMHNLARPGLLHVLEGPSPDYAVVAQKSAASEIMLVFDSVFEVKHGVSLKSIAARHDQSLNADLSEIRQHIESLSKNDQALRIALDSANKKLENVDKYKNHLSNALRKAELHGEQLEISSDKFRQQIAQLTERIDQEENRARWAESVLTEKNARALRQNNLHLTQLAARTQQLEQTIKELNGLLCNAHNWYLRAQAAEQQAAVAEQRMLEVLNSNSWRITAPLRGFRLSIGRLLTLPLSATQALGRSLLGAPMRYLTQHPVLRRRLVNSLRKNPRLFTHLRQFAINRGLVAPPMATESPEPPDENINQLVMLNSRGREIYHALKAAIENKKE